MRYVAIGLIAMAAAMISSWYKKRLRERVEALEAMLGLVEHISSRVSGYMEPPSVWAENFESGSRAVGELLQLIKSGVRPSEAYERSADVIGTSVEAQALLGEFFSSLGGREIAEERRSIDRTLGGLRELVERERRAADERSGVAAVMALMLSAGGAILII